MSYLSTIASQTPEVGNHLRNTVLAAALDSRCYPPFPIRRVGEQATTPPIRTTFSAQVLLSSIARDVSGFET